MEEPSSECSRVIDPGDQCDSNSEFAVICSFISNFGHLIELELDIELLRSCIEDRDNLNEYLIDLHVKLLKKTRRYFIRDQWEKALIRFAGEFSYEDACEIQEFGYLKTRPSTKLKVLRQLLDAQFEHDQKFKTSLNSCEAQDHRIAPLGRDGESNTYWHISDKEGNLRIFQEEPLNPKSWKTVCKTSDELELLISSLEQSQDKKLKGEPMLEPYDPLPLIFPELFVKPENNDESQEESSKTNSKTNNKKGRQKGRRGKKSSPLAILKDVDEKNIDEDQTNHISNTTSMNGTSDPDPKPVPTLDSKIGSPDGENSIESQVRSTLDSILSKVVSSIDFFLKPITISFRESSPQIKAEEVKEQPKSKKRQTRREKPIVEDLPRRTSSRIQLIQQKKEEELKKNIESKANEDLKSNLKIPSEIGVDEFDHERKERTKGKRKGNKKTDWRGKGRRKSLDQSSEISTSSVESNDDELDDMDEDFTFGIANDDDEFACEEEDNNNEPVIIKRARTARQSLAINGTGDPNDSTMIEEDKPCGRCDKSNDPDWILLCDMCNDGYHTACCLPPFFIVPDGDWFCPSCELKMLLIKLKDLLVHVNAILAEKDRERAKRQRLRQAKRECPKQENPPEKRNRDFLPQLNEPIAVQSLDDELLEDGPDLELPNSYREQSSRRNKKSTKRSRQRRRFDYGRPSRTKRRPHRYSDSEESGSDILDCRESSESTLPSASEESEYEEEPKPKVRRARACVSYRFQEYDELIQSAIRESDEEEIKAVDVPTADTITNEEHGDEVEQEQEADEQADGGSRTVCNYSRGKDMAIIEALAYQQENGLAEHNVAQIAVTPEPIPKKKRKGRRLNDLDIESEADSVTSDESFKASTATEEPSEDITEVESEDYTSFDEIIAVKPRGRKSYKKRRKVSYGGEDSDDSDFRPRTRRVASKKISYHESTDDDDLISDQVAKKKKNVLSSDDESGEFLPEKLEPYESNDSSKLQKNLSPPHLPFYEEDVIRVAPTTSSDWQKSNELCKLQKNLSPPHLSFYEEDEIKLAPTTSNDYEE